MPAADILGEDIVQKDKRFGCVVLSLACLSAAMLAGCRSTASPLAEATARAGRLYDRACSLLNDTPYMFREKYAPFATPMTETELPSDPNAAAKPALVNQVKLTALGQINPQADQALKEAVDDLTKALASAEGQPEMDRINAQIVLARLYALRGYRMSIEAGMMRRQAWDLARRTESDAVLISGLGKMIATHDQLLSVTDASLGEMAEAAKVQQSAAEGKIAEAKKKIAGLEKEETDLKAANVKISEDSRKLLAESQLDPIKGVALFDEAKTKEDQAGANSARIAQIEEAVNVLKSQVADLDGIMAAAANQAKAAGEIADNRQKGRSETDQARKAQLDKLTEAQKQAETLAGQVVEASKAAAAAEAKAMGEYDKAVKAYEAYEQITEPYAKDPRAGAFLKPDPAIIAMLGDVQMARADLMVQALLLQQRLQTVASETAGIWSALPVQNTTPAVIGRMKDHVPNPGKVKEDAQRDFSWAARAYEKATDAVSDSKLKWAYVLQQSAANVSLYRLSGDADAKQKATTALNSLGAEEASPLIAPTAGDFRKMLAGPALLGSEAPSGPAPTQPAP
jgi:chromosome segregation ATPase